jgi:hypothetical protein
VYAIHEVFVEIVAGFSRRQFSKRRRETTAIGSQASRATRSPERIIGLGRANIMLTRALRWITIGILIRRTAGVFEREEWKVEEQRVQLESLKAPQLNGKVDKIDGQRGYIITSTSTQAQKVFSMYLERPPFWSKRYPWFDCFSSPSTVRRIDLVGDSFFVGSSGCSLRFKVVSP